MRAMKWVLLSLAILVTGCGQPTAGTADQAESATEALAPAIDSPAAEAKGAAGETLIPVPSDPGATYGLINVAEAEGGLIEVTTVRRGPSGVSYARRLVDCAEMTFTYTGDSDSADLPQVEDPAPMSALVSGSISDHVATYACSHR